MADFNPSILGRLRFRSRANSSVLVPETGALTSFATKNAMVIPATLDEFGAFLMMQPLVFNANVCTFFPNNGSVGTGTNFSGNWTSNGTATHPNPSNTKQGQVRRTKYADVITTQNQYLGPNPNSSYKCFLGGNAAGLGGIFYYARFTLETMPTLGWRLFAGLVDDNTTAGIVVSDTFVGNIAGLSHITTDPTSASSGAWNIITRDNTTTNTVAITPATALATGQAYEFYMYYPPNTATILYKLVLLNDGTTVAEGSTSTNLPGNTTMLAPHCCMSNGTANVVAGDTAIGVANIYCRSMN